MGRPGREVVSFVWEPRGSTEGPGYVVEAPLHRSRPRGAVTVPSYQDITVRSVRTVWERFLMAVDPGMERRMVSARAHVLAMRDAVVVSGLCVAAPAGPWFSTFRLHEPAERDAMPRGVSLYIRLRDVPAALAVARLRTG